MREIKFRAWDKANKKMIPNNRLLKICFVRTKHTPNLIVYANRNIENHTEIKENEKLYCNEFELMQYTGFKDVNGKEIYEGDIVKAVSFARWVGTVKYLSEKGAFVLEDSDDSGFRDDYVYLSQFEDGFEVLGNIYENPELLEEC